jgi:hypothetical protein
MTTSYPSDARSVYLLDHQGGGNTMSRMNARTAAFAVTLAALLLPPAAAWAQEGLPGRMCGLDEPGACFAPQPFPNVAILDEDSEILVAFIQEGQNDFTQLLPNGTVRVHHQDTSAALIYCPTEIVLAGLCNPEHQDELFRGQGHVSGNAVVPPEGGLLCPTEVHIRGQVADPLTGELIDVEGFLLAVGKADLREDCRESGEVNAEPSSDS